MKLIYPDYEYVFDFTEGNHFCITIENPISFRNYVFNLLKQTEGEEGKFTLTDGLKEIEINKNISFITDLLRFEPVDKKISNKISQLLKTFIVNESMYERTADIVAKIENYIISIVEEFPYPVEYDIPEPANLLKTLNLRITSEYNSLLSKLCEYMKLLHDICGISIFVLLGAYTFFTKQELELLIEEANLQKHNIFFIESNPPKDHIKGIKNIIIDKDDCEIF